MYALFALLMGFGVFMGVSDFSHKSYIIAFLVGAALCFCYLYFYEKIPVCENVVILTIVCFVLNGAWTLIYLPVQYGDYDKFMRYAALLAFNGGVAQQTYVELFPHIFGYSFFLSLFLRLFHAGYGTIGAYVNIFLTVGSGLIIWTIVKDFYGKRVAAIAYILWILCPSKLLYNVFNLSEPYYTNLILLFFLIVEKFSLYDKKYFWLTGILAGLLLRLINTARPIALIPMIALGIWLLFLKGYKKGFILFSLLALAVYIPTGALWNSYMESKLLATPATGVPGYNVYVGFDSDHGGTFNEEDMDRLQEYYGSTQDATQAQKNMLNDAIENIKSGKVDFGKLIPSKFRSLLGNDEGGAFYSKDDFSDTWFKVASFLSNIWYYFVFLLSLAGALSVVKRQELTVLQLFPLYVIGLILAQMLVEVSGRYHYSILPMLIVIAMMYQPRSESNGKISLEDSLSSRELSETK